MRARPCRLAGYARSLAIASILILVVPPPGAAQIRLAVMDLKALEGITQNEASSLTGLLRTALHETGSYVIVNREDMQRIAENYGIELALCQEDACLMKLGTSLGAQRLVVGDVGQVFGGVVVNARMVDVTTDTLRTVASASEVAGRDLSALTEAMRRLGGKLGSGGGGTILALGTMRSLEIYPGVQMEFVWIPTGSLDMGSPLGEVDRYGDEGSVHGVAFATGFWLGRYEVTQAQWQAVVGRNPSHFAGDSDLPAESVSWNDIQTFLGQLNARGGTAYRLPSEAEWEYACRAGTTTRFSTGECISPDQANFDGRYPPSGCAEGVFREKTVPVGSFAPNAWGLCDMHGNVWEWCQDIWQGSYAGAPSDGRAWTRGAKEGPRVLRGGSWGSGGRHLRSACRSGSDATLRYSYFGFRLARNP